MRGKASGSPAVRGVLYCSVALIDEWGERLRQASGDGERLPVGEGDRDISVRSRAGRVDPTPILCNDDLKRVVKPGRPRDFVPSCS